AEITQRDLQFLIGPPQLGADAADAPEQVLKFVVGPPDLRDGLADGPAQVRELTGAGLEAGDRLFEPLGRPADGVERLLRGRQDGRRLAEGGLRPGRGPTGNG